MELYQPIGVKPLVYSKDFLNKIICGDCAQMMSFIPENVIDLVVTSPPYDSLRDYNGYNFGFENIAKELFRIIKKGGVIVWIVGDAVINGSETGTSFKQSLFFKKIGLNIHDTMVYAKTNVPFPSLRRYNQSFEYMFVFSKGTPKTFNPIKDRINKTAGMIEENKIRKKDGTIKKSGKLRVTQEVGLRHNIWYYTPGGNNSATDRFARHHPAIFPEKLAEDHILSWSNEGDLVLDPMCGSGTTCKMAKLHNRRFIGVDISEEYCKIAQERIRIGFQYETMHRL